MPAADLAILGARVRTLDPDRPRATAIAMRDGAIVAVGDDADVRAACDARTELIDGSALAIVPGLTDSHFHPFWGAEATQGADLTRVRTIDQPRQALAAERRRVGPDAWVLGWGLVFEVFGETGIRGDLIADAAGSQPAYVGFFDGHTAVVSPAALALADVTGRETFDDFSTVVCDEHGLPTGELRENGAINLVRAAIPKPTAAQRYHWYVEAMRTWNAVGLTGIHAMDGSPTTFDFLRELEGNGDLTVRMVTPLWQKPETPFDEMRAQFPLRDERGRLWRGGVAKFFIDGVIETGTAWLCDPDSKGEGVTPFWPEPARYAAAVRLFAEAGFQCATHAVGDRGVRCALDAYRAADSAPGVRHRIEHIEQLTDEDLPRFREQDVVASMQPLHMLAFRADGSDEWQTRVGPERRCRAFRAGDLRRSGATVALGSDWMVATFDPRIGMAWARLRRPGGERDFAPVLPDQALSPLEALKGYTTQAAHTVSEDQLSGRVKPGYRADLTAFAEDPVDCDADDLPDLPVLLTVVDGQIVHRTG
ncbi:MAG TPA: amidohydrolase [Thermomicrobiales bacterium]|nr:amidohydrolase [Thermomicrobiales bacterium]